MFGQLGSNSFSNKDLLIIHPRPGTPSTRRRRAGSRETEGKPRSFHPEMLKRLLSASSKWIVEEKYLKKASIKNLPHYV